MFKKAVIFLISGYQQIFSFDKGFLALFAPGGACKFEVSCSEYTKQSINDFGLLKGLLMGMRRVWGCR